MTVIGDVRDVAPSVQIAASNRAVRIAERRFPPDWRPPKGANQERQTWNHPFRFAM